MAATSQRVLLTGATGFVGIHVAEAFARAGWQLRVLARSLERARALAALGADVVQGSLEDEASLHSACHDAHVVVHMAALTRARTESEYHAVNVDGTERLLQAVLGAQPQPPRFVYLSSLAAVGPAIDGRGVCAADLPRPLTAYGRSKLAGEAVVLAAADRIEALIVRAPVVYGPYDRDLFHFFRIARTGVMPVPMGPARPLQLVHAQDLARALVRAAEAEGRRGIYHVADAQAYTWEEVVRLIGAAVDRRVRTVRVPALLVRSLAAVSETLAGVAGRSSIFNRDKTRELLAPGWLCETESARADLGFEADIQLPDGLRATAQWYREQGWL